MLKEIHLISNIIKDKKVLLSLNINLILITMKSLYLFSLIALLSIGLLGLSCTTKNGQANSRDNTSVKKQGQAYVVDEESKKNILQIARSSPDHKTLAAAIEAAEIQNVLVNAGPLTIFAPNDAAFEKLPEGTVNDLLKPENKQKLAKILTSHASPASLKKHQLTEDRQIYLATGQYINVEHKEGDIFVNGAKVLATIEASNGMIHVIDSVFLF